MKTFPRKIGQSLRKLRSARDELKKAFPELPFALDGNLVGDIGEAIAIRDFGLKKLKAGTKSHDCEAPDKSLVQIKTTQQTINGRGMGLGLIKKSFDHLIVIQLLEKGYNVLYDGPGSKIDMARKHKKSPSLSVKQLRELNSEVHRKLIK